MPVDIIIPQAGESVTSGVISRWVKAEGQSVKRDEPVLELETDKVTMEIVAPADGVLHIVVQAGETVAIGQKVGAVDGAAVGTPAAPPKAVQAVAGGSPAPAASSVAVAEPSHAEGTNGDVRATPLARKIAAEHGIDLAKVTGTGAGGRVREQDVLAAVEARSKPAPTPEPKPAPAARPAPPVGSRGVTRERMSPLRQRVAQRLVQSQHTAAILTTFNEVDMTAVMDLRKQYKDDFEKKHGVGLGFMSFFVKAAVAALRHMPVANSFIVEENGVPMIERHDYCDVAVAVSTPKGLMVPVLRNAESMSFADVETSLKDLATRARDGKIELAELQGGTFTISNGGVFGSLMGTPIINPPQSAILGMHAIKNRAVEWPVGSGQVAIRPMMYLALSYDHRLLDGADAVQFLVKVKQCIEDPQRLLLGV